MLPSQLGHNMMVKSHGAPCHITGPLCGEGTLGMLRKSHEAPCHIIGPLCGEGGTHMMIKPLRHLVTSRALCVVKVQFYGLVQDCSNSSALALELLQFCAKPSIGMMMNPPLLALCVVKVHLAWWWNPLRHLVTLLALCEGRWCTWHDDKTPRDTLSHYWPLVC